MYVCSFALDSDTENSYVLVAALLCNKMANKCLVVAAAQFQLRKLNMAHHMPHIQTSLVQRSATYDFIKMFYNNDANYSFLNQCCTQSFLSLPKKNWATQVIDKGAIFRISSYILGKLGNLKNHFRAKSRLRLNFKIQGLYVLLIN